MKIQLSNWILVSNAGSASYNRSVSCLWSPLAPDLRSCPCVAAALSGSLAFCARSWRGIQIQTAHVALKVRSMKNCRPVVRLQILSEYKKTAPQGTKGFCRGQASAKWFGVVAERQERITRLYLDEADWFVINGSIRIAYRQVKAE